MKMSVPTETVATTPIPPFAAMATFSLTPITPPNHHQPPGEKVRFIVIHSEDF